jgi:hypothetical protein
LIAREIDRRQLAVVLREPVGGCTGEPCRAAMRGREDDVGRYESPGMDLIVDMLSAPRGSANARFVRLAGTLARPV